MKFKIPGIYMIRNKFNGKVYIGSTMNFGKRFDEHWRGLKGNYHFNEYLQYSWNKHGEENFEFKELETVLNLNKLIEREQYWIDFFQSFQSEKGYNIQERADRTFISEETKKKKSRAMKGKYVGEKSNNVLLTWEKVKEIRELYFSNPSLTQAKLGQMFGVERTTIQSLINNLSWKDDEWLIKYKEIVRKDQRNKKEYHSRAKLDWETVNKIRQYYYDHDLSILKISKIFGVISSSTLFSIIKNKIWKDDEWLKKYTEIRNTKKHIWRNRK